MDYIDTDFIILSDYATFHGEYGAICLFGITTSHIDGKLSVDINNNYYCGG